MQVIAGSAEDKGKTGKVIAVYPDTQRVLVEGVKRIKKHTKVGSTGRGARTGGIVTQRGRDPHQQRDAGGPGDQEADPGRDAAPRPSSATAGARPCGSGSPSARVRTSEHDYLHTHQDRCRGCKLRYRAEIAPALHKEFGYANVMQVPGLVKIVVNMGVGEAAKDSKLIEGAIRDLTAITGQKPQVTKARKSIAQFKLREGMPIGAHVTLRGDRMWEFARPAAVGGAAPDP